MGKKKKQEKLKKKDKLQKAEKAAQKAAKAEKDKVREKNTEQKKSARPPAGTAGMKAPHRSPDEDAIYKTAECFRALGDENRLKILALLADRELCAGEILKSMSIVQSTLSHHMKILVEAGIVKCRRQGKWSYYSVDGGIRERLESLTEAVMHF